MIVDDVDGVVVSATILPGSHLKQKSLIAAYIHVEHESNGVLIKVYWDVVVCVSSDVPYRGTEDAWFTGPAEPIIMTWKNRIFFMTIFRWSKCLWKVGVRIWSSVSPYPYRMWTKVWITDYGAGRARCRRNSHFSTFEQTMD